MRPKAAPALVLASSEEVAGGGVAPAGAGDGEAAGGVGGLVEVGAAVDPGGGCGAAGGAVGGVVAAGLPGQGAGDGQVRSAVTPPPLTWVMVSSGRNSWVVVLPAIVFPTESAERSTSTTRPPERHGRILGTDKLLGLSHATV